MHSAHFVSLESDRVPPVPVLLLAANVVKLLLIISYQHHGSLWLEEDLLDYHLYGEIEYAKFH